MSVLNSRRLWTFILAQVVSGAALAVSLLVKDPAATQIATWFIGFAEGLAAILITLLTIDDSRLNTAQAKAETAKHEATVQADASIQIAAIQAGTHPQYFTAAPESKQEGPVK